MRVKKVVMYDRCMMDDEWGCQAMRRQVHDFYIGLSTPAESGIIGTADVDPSQGWSVAC